MQNWEQQQPSGSGKHTRMENYVGFVTGLCQEWNKLAFTKSLIVVFATNTVMPPVFTSLRVILVFI